MAPKNQCWGLGLEMDRKKQDGGHGSKTSPKSEDPLCAVKGQGSPAVNCLTLLSSWELPCVWVSTGKISKGRKKEEKSQMGWLGPQESFFYSIQYTCCHPINPFTPTWPPISILVPGVRLRLIWTFNGVLGPGVFKLCSFEEKRTFGDWNWCLHMLHIS